MAKDSNIDSFYKGYYSEISLGIMPHLTLEDKQEIGAIEVQAKNQSSSAGGQSGQESSLKSESKKYLVNDGATSIFYKGAKKLELTAEEVKNLNLLQDNEQDGVLKGNLDYLGDLLACTECCFLLPDREDAVF